MTQEPSNPVGTGAGTGVPEETERKRGRPPRTQVVEPPPSVPLGSDFTTGGERKGKMAWGNILLPIVASVAVMFLLSNLFLVTKSDFTKNVGGIAETIASKVKELTDSQAAMTKAFNEQATNLTANTTKAAQDVAGFKTQLATYATKEDVSGVRTSIADIQSKLSTTQSDLGKLQSGLTTITSQVSSLPQNLVTLKQLTTLSDQLVKDEATIKAVSDQLSAFDATVHTLSTRLTDSEATIKKQGTDIADLKTKVTALQTPPPTTTTTGTVTATISGNPFTGSASMNFTPILAGTANSSQFTIQVVNNTTKTVTGLQLALGIQVFDNTNPNVPVPYAIPSYITTTLSSGTLFILWSSQSTGSASILGYVNQAASGFLASLSTWSQPPGTVNYVQTFVVTVQGAPNTLSSPNLIFYPTVKVIGYTAN